MISKDKSEPKEAFLYQPPDEYVKEKFQHIFHISKPLDICITKYLFDKMAAILVLFISCPFFCFLKLLYFIEGCLIPENKGPMFFSYKAVSAGKVFSKYKIRLIKMKYIDKKGAERGDWNAFSAEWSRESRTYAGQFVKKYYLDELPQFYNVLIGDMSIVGPRPLAVHHYERDLQQGNVARFIMKAGLIGLGHVRKGTPEMGQPMYEYEYIDQYLKRSALGVLLFDLQIIWKGIKVIIQGKGL